jgi:dTDP-4-amino-4,6-dideoxy-D-glucose acyltransferase
VSDYVNGVHRLANIVGDVEIGAGSRVDAFATITGPAKIGRYCHIGTGACIFGGGGFTMGDYSSLSPGAKVFTGTEDISGDWAMGPCVPKHLRRVISRPVRFGVHCTVGTNSVVLPGADFPDGACLGALSMAKSPLSPWSIWAGSPAQFKRSRSRGILERVSQQRPGEPG